MVSASRAPGKFQICASEVSERMKYRLCPAGASVSLLCHFHSSVSQLILGLDDTTVLFDSRAGKLGHVFLHDSAARPKCCVRCCHRWLSARKPEPYCARVAWFLLRLLHLDREK